MQSKLAITTQIIRRVPTQRLRRAAQRGITNVQIIIAIGVGLVLLIGALAGLNYFTKAKVHNEVAAITDLKSNIVNYGAKKGQFTAANTTMAILVGQNFWPDSAVTPAAAAGGAPTVNNQWGGTIVCAPNALVNAGDSMLCTYTGVPAKACQELGTSLDDAAATVTINAVVTKAQAAQTNSALVAANCGGAAGDNNTMAVVFAK